MNTLGVVDTTVIFFYLIAVIAIGLYFSRKKDQNSSDYFLAGRELGWIAVGLSLFATNISSEHFIGLAGSGASRGLAVGDFEWLAVILLFMLGYIFAPLYIKSGVYTIPEYLEKRFDKRSRYYLTTLSIVAYIFTKITVTLFAGGLLLHEVLGWDIYVSTLIMVLLTGVYTMAGGLRAVVYTQIFQAVVLITGASLLTIFGLHEVGGISGLISKLPADYFNLVKPASDPDFPWTGILFGAPIIGFWYWCTDQYILQRVLAAKNIDQARKGTQFAAMLKILPMFILVLPGLIAVAIFPGVRGDQAYQFLLTGRILPAGIKGIVIAGLFAAIMSSLSSVFNSTATLFTMDFYKSFHPEASDRKLVLVGRLSTTVMVVTAIFWVPLLSFISSEIYIYLQSVQAYIAPPITALFILAIFHKRTNSTGAIWGLAAGGIVGLTRMILEISGTNAAQSSPLISWFVGINYLHFAVLLFVFSTVTMVLVSYLKTSAVPQLSNYSGRYNR